MNLIDKVAQSEATLSSGRILETEELHTQIHEVILIVFQILKDPEASHSPGNQPSKPIRRHIKDFRDTSQKYPTYLI